MLRREQEVHKLKRDFPVLWPYFNSAARSEVALVRRNFPKGHDAPPLFSKFLSPLSESRSLSPSALEGLASSPGAGSDGDDSKRPHSPEHKEPATPSRRAISKLRGNWVLGLCHWCVSLCMCLRACVLVLSSEPVVTALSVFVRSFSCVCVCSHCMSFLSRRSCGVVVCMNVHGAVHDRAWCA